MDFAKKQLEKYGWKEGEGLGRNKSGISKAIRPKLKFDTGGLGHDLFEDINNCWWQRLYDEAAKNIITKKNEDDSIVLETVEQSVEITTRKKSKKKKPSGTVYTNFIKTSELNHNTEKKVIMEGDDEEPEVKKKKNVAEGITDYTDEDLFKICGGRTAHKAARHGLRMNAKLARLKYQEDSLILNSSKATISEKMVKSTKKKNKQ